MVYRDNEFNDQVIHYFVDIEIENDLNDAPRSVARGGGGGGSSLFPHERTVDYTDMDVRTFGEQLIRICRKYHETKRAMAFAFMLYDEVSPHISKVLADRDYLAALDQKTGKSLIVFFLRRVPAITSWNKNRKAWNRLARSRRQQHATDRPASLRKKNHLTKEYFGIKHISSPAIIFFQVDQMRITGTAVIELKAEKVEESFQEIMGYFSAAVNALDEISPQYAKNYNEIFENLVLSVKGDEQFKRIKKIGKAFGDIIGFIFSLKDFF